ncbi:MAG: hypothetical protein A3C12_00140 [Candidatus Sungbacteria bacterium RIFCSPHIGHO2_02_FULL_49_20]|uniref:Transcription termination/antitermination protein NusA n=2 Tax=Candidatus Sungiibacteriota TaxID=1817917 RepID=A0A1G2KQ59_9BACT|nr:MAG: hypothetical protein A3C12_00140 [Candidatus Sungbacteria bacterium RIFCSPHIGHO2_02_FULL_49_20]
MFDLKQFGPAIQQIAEEKGIAVEKIVETIGMALAAAYKKDYGKKGQIIRAAFNPQTGDVKMHQVKIVVDESMLKTPDEVAVEDEERQNRLAEGLRRAGVGGFRRDDDDDDFQLNGEEPKKVRFNPEKHLMIAEAQKINPDAKLGDEIEFPIEFREDFGRIAAQTAKQVIIQRIREAERDAIYNEYKDREGELLTGMIQRVEGRNVFIDMGRTTSLLPPEEQMPFERYNIGERLKMLLIAVERNPRGPGIIVSRSHPRLVKKLFELEVPEIASGSVEIKFIAREAGSRSKIAVVSHQEGVDPVGSLVGQKGVRVSTVIHELGGEKIDIIEWSEDQAEFIAHALSPAKVIEVYVNPEMREARAIVPDEQLSLAIGKGGQNVRLAAKLTGWKIDVRSDKKEETPPAEIAKNEDETPAEKTTTEETSTNEAITRESEASEKKEISPTEEKTEAPKKTKKSRTKKTTNKE